MRKISLFIAMSLDGYIAQPNNDLSFLKLVEKEGEDTVMKNLHQKSTPSSLVEKLTITSLRKSVRPTTTMVNGMYM